MTDDELRAALPHRDPKPEKANPARHVSEIVGCDDQHAATFARAKGLIDADGMLHCWKCSEVTDWHVSLHCAPCRVESRARAPERRRLEQDAARRQRDQEQSRPQQRVAGRSFRDEY